LPLALLAAAAGIMSPPQRLVSEDGLELQFQVRGGWWAAHMAVGVQQ
jgi:hypothetical protein